MEVKDKTFNEFNDEEIDIFGEVVGYLIGSKNDLESFENVSKAYKALRQFVLNNSDSNKKNLSINKTFVVDTLKDFIGNLEGKEKVDRITDNLIGLYEDRLDSNEIPEDIIKFELDLPKKGNREQWINLIEGIIELSDGKTKKFINESNKVLTLYKKEK